MITAHHSSEMDNTLKSFINNIYKATKSAKKIFNALNGSFNMTKSKHQLDNYITDSYDEASYYYHTFQGNATISTLSLKYGKEKKFASRDVSPEKVLFRVHENLNKLTDNKPIYFSIVQRANLESFILLQRVKATPKTIPRQIKTDCVYYTLRKDLKKVQTRKKPERGEYREEKSIPDKFKVKVRRPRDQYLRYVPTREEKEEHKANRILQLGKHSRIR